MSDPPTSQPDPLNPEDLATAIQETVTPAIEPIQSPEPAPITTPHRFGEDNPYRFQPGNKLYLEAHKAQEERRKTLRDYLIEDLNRPYVHPNGKIKGRTRWWAVAKAWVDKAIAGSERAQAELRDTIEGRPLQRQEISGVDGQPVMIASGAWWPALSAHGEEPPQLAPPPGWSDTAPLLEADAPTTDFTGCDTPPSVSEPDPAEVGVEPERI